MGLNTWKNRQMKYEDLSDENLEKKLRASIVVRKYPGLQDWVLELLERYNNKKNECEVLESRLNDAQWTIFAQRVDFSQDSW